jgi:hypothetical protein
MQMNNVISVVIVDQGENDPLVIGPFATGDEASSWGFKNMPVGTLWHWLPLLHPCCEEWSKHVTA